MTVAERIELLLTLKNLDEATVAKRAGLDRQAVWKIIRGDTPNPGILTVKRIVHAAGATMVEFFSLREFTMEERLVVEIRRALYNATDGKLAEPGFLTAYQVLDRLPADLRTRLIDQRGGVGAGSGASYGPTKDIVNAINKLGGEVDSGYMDVRGLTFKIGNDTVTPGYPIVSIYRIKKILVKDLRPGMKNWFVRSGALRIDTQRQWWLDPNAEVRGGFSDETPILIMRGDNGFIANRPDIGAWTIYPEVLDEYPGFIKLLHPLGEFQVAAFKP